MVAAHMYPQYPWSSSVQPDPDVRGRGYPQTDHAETFYPLSVFATDAIRDGEFPLWLPFSFGGIPVIEHGLSGLLYPPRLLLMLFLSPIRQHDVLLLTHLLLAGISMYALLRLHGIGGTGALLGAMVWELNGHNAFWLVMEHVAIAASWLPLMLLGASLAVRKLSPLWAIVAGAAVAMPVLAGSLHYAYLNGIIIGGWYASHVVRTGSSLYRERRRKDLIICLSLPFLSLVVAAAVGAASWLPLFQWASDLHREPLVLQIQLDEAIGFKRLVQSLILSCGGYRQEASYSCLALTGLPAVLMTAIAFTKRSGLTIFGGLLAVISIPTALGIRLWLELARELIPGFDTMHLHLSFYVLGVGIAILAAVGMDRLVRLLSGKKAGSLAAAVLVALTIGAEGWQLFQNARGINPRHPEADRWLFPETPLISRLRELQGDSRILPVLERNRSGAWTPPVLAGKVSAIFKLRSGSGYESLLPSYIARLWRSVEQGGLPSENIPPAYRPYFFHDRLPMDTLGKLSVGLLATPPGVKPLDISGTDPLAGGMLQLIYDGKDGRIYRNLKALPRAYLISRAIVLGPEEALAKICDPGFDSSSEAIITSAPSNTTGYDASADLSESQSEIVIDGINEVTVQTASRFPAILVLNDSWAPGWKAYVDGSAQPVLRTNYAFRGVEVPEGRHVVEFKYRPASLLLGIKISAAALASVMLGVILLRLSKYKARKTGPRRKVAVLPANKLHSKESPPE